MNVYISDPNEESLVANIVRELGHKVILPLGSENGRLKEDFSRKSLNDADVAIFPINKGVKMGIMDHLFASSVGIPALSIRDREDEGKSLSENIEIMSRLVYYSDFLELKTKIQDFLDGVTNRIETITSGPCKERR